MDFTPVDTSQITVAIPTKNSSRTIMAVLDYLKYQLCDLNILICDNDSTDGTPEMIEAQIKNNIHPQFKITSKKVGSIRGGKEQNIPYMRRIMSEFITTPYIFWLDSDVVLAPNSLIPHFKKFLEIKDKVGLFGIRYEPKADHVQMGASFMETSVARQINWKWDETGCDCRNTLVQLGAMNLGTDYNEELQARHAKFL